jgi:hypothetical protein
MGRRDYELEAAIAAVDGYFTEPVVRALIVGSSGSQEGTLGGAIKSLFGRSRRKSGLRHQNVLVLTDKSIRVFTCTGGRAWPPRVDEQVGAWPVNDVKVAAEAAEKVVGVLGHGQRLGDEPLLQHHADGPRRRGARRRPVPAHRLGAHDDPGPRGRDGKQAVTDHRTPAKEATTRAGSAAGASGER